MVKPIFIVVLPGQVSVEKRNETRIYLEHKLSIDYHVFVVIEDSVSRIEFKMFSDKEIEPIKLEELKQLLKC